MYDCAVLASLTIRLNLHGVAHFHGVEQAAVVVGKLVGTLVAGCFENLVRSIDADTGRTQKTAARCNGAEGKGDTVAIDIMVCAGTGRVGK